MPVFVGSRLPAAVRVRSPRSIPSPALSGTNVHQIRVTGGTKYSLRSSRFLSFSRRRDSNKRASKRACKGGACGEQKMRRSREGVSEKAERLGLIASVSLAHLTPSPSSLFIRSLFRSFRSCFFWERLKRNEIEPILSLGRT